MGKEADSFNFLQRTSGLSAVCLQSVG